MASYVLLMNWTDQGIRSIKTWPERVAGAHKLVESLEGNLHSLYMTMGAHYAVAVVDSLDDEGRAKLALGIGQLGNVRTATMRAFPEAEAQQVIQGS